MNTTKSPRSVLLILGNLLFSLDHLPSPAEVCVFMAQDSDLCTYVRHHQQKIVLFLSAMRSYADELREAGYRVFYHELDMRAMPRFEERLDRVLTGTGAGELLYFDVEDKPMEQRLSAYIAERQLPSRTLRSPMFLCTRDEFAEYAKGKSRLLISDFYKRQRQRVNILVDDFMEPAGGRWSFDEDNRRKLPKNVNPPVVNWPAPSPHVESVVRIVSKAFSVHPGDATEFCWPSTRRQARDWLDAFIEQRLELFGPYEDAMSTRSETVFHSLLTPVLNIGLITPAQVVEAVLKRADAMPLQSLEGFIRQIIGWREFVRGVYQVYGERQEASNFWSHHRVLTDSWYEGSTGIEPLDHTIRTAQGLGWTHHIPRLMIMGNLMTLCEIEPNCAHQWFMEMYIDSSEWVMGPSVYGMGLFSDGGVFATKPYLCGSNYLLKMSDYRKGPWCDIVDGLYWRFIDKHRSYFLSNPRLAVMPAMFDRLTDERKARIFAAAEQFIAEHTRDASSSVNTAP